ncbi:MAG: carbohydrate ABC transporter permease [Bacilli bacterium]
MKRHNLIGWIFSSPYLILTIIFFFIPLGWAIFLGFTNWNLMSPDFNMVGFVNFTRAFKDPKVIAAFYNTFKYILIIVPSATIISFLIAYIIFSLPAKLKPIFSIMFFIPYISSGVAISFVVSGIFSYNSPLNTFLKTTFNYSLALNKNENMAFLVICGMIVWKISGYYSLFLLSSLESIQSDLHDSCKLDGCYGFTKIKKMIIPLILPTLTTVIILSVGLCFGIYTEPYMLTGGGPNLATTTWQLEIFNQSFVKFDSGYSSAIAILNSIIILLCITILQKLLKKWRLKYGWE